MNEGICKSCGEKMLWVKMAATGRSNPLDVKPVENGNIQLNLNGQGVILSKEVIAKMREKGTALLYLSHFATCPGAASHRKSAS